MKAGLFELTCRSPKRLGRAAQSGGNQMALRIKLPGGTLKVKTYRELRDRERDRRVPVWKMRAIYLIWWSNKQTL